MGKVRIFAVVNSKNSMNGNNTERLPQEVERHQDGESGILESASAFAYRVLEEIEALAGATACKSSNW